MHTRLRRAHMRHVLVSALFVEVMLVFGAPREHEDWGGRDAWTERLETFLRDVLENRITPR